MMEMFFCDHPDSDCLLFAYIMSQNQQLGIFFADLQHVYDESPMSSHINCMQHDSSCA